MRLRVKVMQIPPDIHFSAEAVRGLIGQTPTFNDGSRTCTVVDAEIEDDWLVLTADFPDGEVWQVAPPFVSLG